MHPSESTLALYAGRDVGLLTRLRVLYHLRSCATCSRHAEEFNSIRDWTIGQDEMPAGVDWDVLGPELKANIRLGLAAGQCVSQDTNELPPQFRWRWAAMALPAFLVLVAVLIQVSPGPRHTQPVASAGQILEASSVGIGLEQDGRGFSVVHPRAENVYLFVSGPDVRSRYVDSDTGNVTISHVYAE